MAPLKVGFGILGLGFGFNVEVSTRFGVLGCGGRGLENWGGRIPGFGVGVTDLG